MPEIRIKHTSELRNIISSENRDGASKRKVKCPACKQGFRYHDGDRWTRCDKCGFGGIR